VDDAGDAICRKLEYIMSKGWKCLLSKNCQEDVDQEVSTTSALKEDTKRWEDDGENDLADIAFEKVSFLCSF
jgi:hypothetical protein